MITELAIEFVESVKETYQNEINNGEENHEMFFHFFNDFMIYCNLVTHNNFPFKISEVYRFENECGIIFDKKIINKFINEVNSLL